MLSTILSASGIAETIIQIIRAAPDVLSAAKTWSGKLASAVQVITGQVTGQAATDAIASIQADIEGHFAHMEAEYAKLGQ